MDITIEKIIIAFIGGLVGFALPYATRLWEKRKKANKIKSALYAEFKFAKKKINEKLIWLGRDVSKHINYCDEKRVVDYEEKKLFLGEREKFDLNCTYWENKYHEIVEILSEEEFLYFADIHKDILEFIEKFDQMKASFETNYGEPKLMVIACYRDLLKINVRIEEKL